MKSNRDEAVTDKKPRKNVKLGEPVSTETLGYG